MAFWQVIILLSLSATVFVLWPLIKFPFLKKALAQQASYDETQVELYQEHLADLERALANSEISQEQFAELKLELQKALVNDESLASAARPPSSRGKRAVFMLAVAIPLLSVFLYTRWGARADWDIYQHLQSLPAATSHEDYESRLRQISTRIQTRLNRTPDNAGLRHVLAQTSMTLQDYDLAVDSYRKILEQFPGSPAIISNLAQAMFYRAGNVVTPEVRQYTQQALELAPMLPEMLGLAGIDAKNRGDYREAIRYWKLAMSQMDPDSRSAQGYLNGISNAEKALQDAGEPLEEPRKEDAGGETAAATQALTVKVTLGEAVKLQGGETVFVYARAWNGPKMPLAIKKLSIQELPAEIVLDESMAMAPGMSIDKFPELEVVARISRTGSPSPQSGDWEATQGPVRLSEQKGPISLVIASQVP